MFITPFCLQARRQRPHLARAPRPAEALYTACHTASCSPDEEFALKLYWGRQRGIAVIFATDAMEHAQRCVRKSLPLPEQLLQIFLHINMFLAHNLTLHCKCTIQVLPYCMRRTQKPRRRACLLLMMPLVVCICTHGCAQGDIDVMDMPLLMMPVVVLALTCAALLCAG